MSQLAQANKVKQGRILSSNQNAAEIDAESGASESLDSNYEENKISGYGNANINAENPQMGEYEVV